MICYLRASETQNALLHQAFLKSFADYLVPMAMDQAAFTELFFGPEGNAPEHSFLAMRGEEPVGLCLGGIRHFDGLRTLRCGALAVVPDLRGSGVSRELMRLHKEEGLAQGCRQLFLEVIADNRRALNFYQGLGYFKAYELKFYAIERQNWLSKSLTEEFTVEEIPFKQIAEKRRLLKGQHINWQNEIEALERVHEKHCLGILRKGKLVACALLGAKGKLHFLWVKEAMRCKGLATALVSALFEGFQPQQITLSFSNNAALEGFARKTGWTQKDLFEYEMCLPLQAVWNEITVH
ncbi:MAG: GNAT family N-acetyltransferase [Anaerolineaceae bacterium]|nr:GNAT family N-acetyltransferase [Anaerolineaceae bacterium]